MGDGELDFMTGQLHTTILKLTKVQRGIEELLSGLQEVETRLNALEENQQNIFAGLSALGKRVDSRASELSTDVNGVKNDVKNLGNIIRTSETELANRVEGLGSDLTTLDEGLKKALSESEERLTNHIVDLEYRVKSLDDSLAMIKTLNTELKSNIRAMTYELKKTISELIEAEGERYERLKELLDTFEEDLNKRLEVQQKLLDLHSEKLEVLRGELFELRESTLVNFGLLSSKVDAVETLEMIGRNEDVREP